MKTILKSLTSLSLLPLILFFVSSCTKNDIVTSGNSFRLDPSLIPKTFSVILSDGPGDYQQVVLDIQKVEVKEDIDFTHYDDDQFADTDDNADDHLSATDSFGVWKPLNFTPAAIDISSLRNGLETNLGNIVIYNKIRKVRITLGSNSFIIDQNGDKQQLILPNESDKFMYVNLHTTDIDYVSSDENQIVRIDFNIEKSIKEDNGVYFLSPNVRPYCLTNFGEIEGEVTPLDIKAKVTIEDEFGNNYIAYPEADGEFKVRGLPAGDNYIVTYEAVGYIKQVVNTVHVIAGKETYMDPVVLIQ